MKLAAGAAVEPLRFPETREEFAMHPAHLRLRLRSARTFATAAALVAAVVATVSATVAAGTAYAGTDKPAPAQNLTIPFADHHGIEDWQADGDRGLWILARDRKWYYARFFAPCFGLSFHESLRFKFGPGGELDRWSEVYTHDSGRCAFTSLVASDGPPRKPKAVKPVGAPATPATPATTAPGTPAPAG